MPPAEAAADEDSRDAESMPTDGPGLSPGAAAAASAAAETALASLLRSLEPPPLTEAKSHALDMDSLAESVDAISRAAGLSRGSEPGAIEPGSSSRSSLRIPADVGRDSGDDWSIHFDFNTQVRFLASSTRRGSFLAAAGAHSTPNSRLFFAHQLCVLFHVDAAGVKKDVPALVQVIREGVEAGVEARLVSAGRRQKEPYIKAGMAFALFLHLCTFFLLLATLQHPSKKSPSPRAACVLWSIARRSESLHTKIPPCSSPK